MDLQTSGAKGTVNQRADMLLLDIDDFNSLISTLKRREENIIQLLDYNLKYKNSSKEEDIKQLKALYNQLSELERNRQSKENEIIAKYINLKVSDGKQKRLIMKLSSKIIQLNSSVQEKLCELEIADRARESYRLRTQFEENLKSLSNKMIVDVDVVLNYVIKNSRTRFLKELNPERPPDSNSAKAYLHPPNADPYKRGKNYEYNMLKNNSNNNQGKENNTGSNLNGMVGEGVEIKNSIKKFRGQEGNVSPNKFRPPNYQKASTINNLNYDRRVDELAIGPDSGTKAIPRSTSNTKNFDKNASSATNMGMVNAGSQLNVSNNTNNNTSSNNGIALNSNRGSSINYQQQDKESLSTISNKKDVANGNSSNIGVTGNQLPELNNVNYQYNNNNNNNNNNNQKKMMRINKSNKSLAGIDEITSPNGAVENKLSDLKAQKQNLQDSWKPYDVLRIEVGKAMPQSIRNKKNMIEKLVSELTSQNYEVRRTINRYKYDYSCFNERKKSKQKNFVIHDTNLVNGSSSNGQNNRSHISTPQQTKSTNNTSSQNTNTTSSSYQGQHLLGQNGSNNGSVNSNGAFLSSGGNGSNGGGNNGTPTPKQPQRGHGSANPFTNKQSSQNNSLNNTSIIKNGQMDRTFDQQQHRMAGMIGGSLQDHQLSGNLSANGNGYNPPQSINALSQRNKKQDQGKVLVLPKLNLFEDSNTPYTQQSIGTPNQEYPNQLQMYQQQLHMYQVQQATGVAKTRFFLGSDGKGAYSPALANGILKQDLSENGPQGNIFAANDNYGFMKSSGIQQNGGVSKGTAPSNSMTKNQPHSANKNNRHLTSVNTNKQFVGNPPTELSIQGQLSSQSNGAQSTSPSIVEKKRIAQKG